MVLSRPCHPDDQFTTSILRHWCMKHDELLAEHIKSLLIKNNSLPRKRQRCDPCAARGRHLAVRGSPWPPLFLCPVADACAGASLTPPRPLSPSPMACLPFQKGWWGCPATPGPHPDPFSWPPPA